MSLGPPTLAGTLVPFCIAARPCIEDPEPVQRINDHGLDADEVVFVIGAAGGCGAVVYGAAWAVS